MSSLVEDKLRILDVPDVVIQDHLFPLLQLDDLLRLRRVCKATKNLSETYLRVHHYDNPREIEITDGKEKSISNFIAMGIPAARIYLNNNSVTFFEHQDIPEFLELFADKITHLRVHHFSAFTNKSEESFFSALTNLAHLELEEIDATKWNCKHKFVLAKGSVLPRPPVPITKNFKNLKTLKFGHIQPSSKEDHGYWEDITECCSESLEYIGHPFYDHPHPLVEQNGPVELPLPPNVPLPPLEQTQRFCNTGPLCCVKRVINSRARGTRNLQFYDLQKFKDVPMQGGSSSAFQPVLSLCYERGVKMLNVDSELFRGLILYDDKQFKEAVAPIVSIKNTNRSLFKGELPNLEKVVILRTSYPHCSIYPYWMHGERKPQWPQLKILDITIDSNEFQKPERGRRTENLDVEQRGLYEFLFTDALRLELTDLSLRFHEQVLKSENLPAPGLLLDVKSSCPSLKKLTLVNWSGTNKALSKFWGELECLEELVLQNCAELGNVAFVGKDTDNPTFFKLKNLKMLTLSGLDIMPKITDTLFNLVIRHMNLKKLILRSENPIKTITTSGIKSLLTGEFASSIEKFPFKGWSLCGVAQDEFKKVEREFRAYYMI